VCVPIDAAIVTAIVVASVVDDASVSTVAVDIVVVVVVVVAFVAADATAAIVAYIVFVCVCVRVEAPCNQQLTSIAHQF
jgi:hypothetical protein